MPFESQVRLKVAYDGILKRGRGLTTVVVLIVVQGGREDDPARPNLPSQIDRLAPRLIVNFNVPHPTAFELSQSFLSVSPCLCLSLNPVNMEP